MKFIEWQERYLNIYLKPRIKYHTYMIYYELYKNHINDYLGDKEIEEITISDLNYYLFNLTEKENGRGGKLSGSTINLILTLLKSTFKEAYESEIIPKNPATKLKKVAVQEKNVQALTVKEQKKLIDYCLCHIDDTRYLGIILTLATGLRIGELLGLLWTNIDLRNKVINVDTTLIRLKNENGWYYERTKPKSITSKRMIPIPKFLYDILSFNKKNQVSKYVISYNKCFIKVRSYQDFYRSLLKKVGIKYVSFHALRHTFATRCVELGIDIKTVSELLGHKNATITLNRYSHSLYSTKRKAINKLAKATIIR